MDLLKRFISDWKKFSDEKNILIYQMGKVGSTSLEETIPGAIHIHRLFNINHDYFFYSPRGTSFVHKILGGFYDKSRRIAINRRKKIKIITLVRDPFTRNVSAFFQNLAFWLVFYSGKVITQHRVDNPDFVFKAFDEVFDHDYPFTWFDRELKHLTGIDVFECDFDKQKGWSRITKGKYDILIIRFEDLNNLTQIIGEFSGSNIRLKRSNLSGSKWYGQIYKDFIDTYTPGEDYIRFLYGSKLAKHFYTESEIENFKKKALRC